MYVKCYRYYQDLLKNILENVRSCYNERAITYVRYEDLNIFEYIEYKN